MTAPSTIPALPTAGASSGRATAGLTFVALASLTVLAASLAASFRLGLAGDLGTALQANGARVVLGAGAGAAFALAGALRQAAGREGPLRELALLGLAAGAAGGGFALASGRVGGAAWLGFAAGSALGAALAFALVRAIDRPRRWTNLAAGLLLALFTAVAALAGTSARERQDALAPIVAWLLGDLSGATGLSAGLVLALAIGLVVAAARAGARGREAIALLAFGLGLGSGGPLAFVGALVPRAVRSLAPGAREAALLPACALAGAATVVAIDAVPRLLVGGYVLPWNVGAAMLAIPIFLGWNRARLRREAGAAPLAFEAAELLLIAAMTAVGLWLVWTLARVIQAAT